MIKPTDLLIKLPQGKRRQIREHNLMLSLTGTKRGTTKAFSVFYKCKWHTIETKSLSEARKIATDAPSYFGDIFIPPTMNDAIKAYTEHLELKGIALTTWIKYQKVKKKYLSNDNTPLEEVTPKYLFDTYLKPLLKESKYSMADYLKSKLIAIMDLASITYSDLVIRDIRPINRLMVKPKEQKHFPTLGSEHIGLIADNLKSIKIKYLFLLSVHLLIRPNEVVNIKLEDIQDNVLTIPKTKTNTNFKIPLSIPVLALIEDIKNLKEKPNNPYLFEGVHGHLNSSSLNVALKRAGYRGLQTAHGIRAMGRTWLESQGIRYEVAEACLNHTIGNNTYRAYVRTDYFEDRIDVMSKWSTYVLSVCRPSWFS